MVHQTKVLLTLSPLFITRLVSVFLVPAMFLLGSCSKAPESGENIIMKENAPVMSARNIEVLFSDSGKVQAKLTSPLMNRYTGENPFLEFPKGQFKRS